MEITLPVLVALGLATCLVGIADELDLVLAADLLNQPSALDVAAGDRAALGECVAIDLCFNNIPTVAAVIATPAAGGSSSSWLSLTHD
ncbi:hypothetical protein C449_16098 [Halococcus saccharolyticus DSM 5350]|uniref:Uncharacterized protein n=1 Tax=Halococcus saccharolyticus DSM 5350 TaxID=1227455 RepID=M0ME38_9EURY|nr:hypothetical protein C449_16098 [Halococcus saccharolyticus DSM 5350]